MLAQFKIKSIFSDNIIPLEKGQPEIINQLFQIIIQVFRVWVAFLFSEEVFRN